MWVRGRRNDRTGRLAKQADPQKSKRSVPTRTRSTRIQNTSGAAETKKTRFYGCNSRFSEVPKPQNGRRDLSIYQQSTHMLPQKIFQSTNINTSPINNSASNKNNSLFNKNTLSITTKRTILSTSTQSTITILSTSTQTCYQSTHPAPERTKFTELQLKHLGDCQQAPARRTDEGRRRLGSMCAAT